MADKKNISRATPIDTRCTARVKDVPKDKRPPGPANPPMWCCLPAGHDGPHKCNFGGMTSPVPFRDSDEIEWLPLKSPATSAPRVVTADDVERANRIYGEKAFPGNTREAMRAALESFASQPHAARDGWVLVPVEPTAEMLSCIAFGKWPEDSNAGKELQRMRGCDVVFPKSEIEMAVGQYQRMLAAAPTAGERG